MKNEGDITNKMLLQHMQGIKYELQVQMKEMKVDLQQQMKEMKVDLQQQITKLDKKVDMGFEDAGAHRQALQEDLDATIRMQWKHQKQLAKIAA